MNAIELALCLSAVAMSSISQLCIKGAMSRSARLAAFGMLGLGAGLLCCSVLLVVLVLRTVPLSQLMPFAAMAYVLVPLGSRLVFREQLAPRFWLGAILIFCGVMWVHS